MTRTIGLTIAWTLARTLPAFCQTAPIAKDALEFEVASIRPSGPQSVRGSQGGPGRSDPTRYSFGKATLLDLICTAWSVASFQISSHTSLDKQQFDLVANVPTGATLEQFRAMLRNLLSERFGLKTHLESREFPAYQLVVAKSGLKIREADGGDAPAPKVATTRSIVGAFELVSVNAQLEPVSVIIPFLPTPDQLSIVDKTGLTGKYNFALEYSMDLPGATPDSRPPAPAVFTALQHQLGLQLVAAKLPFDVVVVESFSKLPIEN